MNKDHHFLSRLDRVSASHCELALSLYRDKELLTEILKASRIPDGCERAAISLASGDRGPFIVVDRSGQFITCLGEGMSPGTAPVITHARLTEIASHVQMLAGRMKAATELAPGGNIEKLAERVASAADTLSREEMYALFGFKNLIGRGLFVAFLEEFIDAIALLHPLGRIGKLRTTDHPKVLGFWYVLWGIAHSCVLTSTIEPEGMLGPLTHCLGTVLTSLNVMGLNQQGFMLRGAWAAPCAEETLRLYELEYGAAKASVEFMDALLGCLMIGIRNPSLRQRVRKVLSSPPDRTERDWSQEHEQLKETIPLVLREAPELEPAALQYARGVAMRWNKNAPACRQFASAEEIPPDFAMAAVMNANLPAPRDSEQTRVFLSLIPWLARAKPEDLYMRRQDLADFLPRPALSRAEELVRAVSLGFGRNPRPAQQKVPGPNDPCSCGSGKKYKRCCGVPSTARPQEEEPLPTYAKAAGLKMPEEHHES